MDVNALLREAKVRAKRMKVDAPNQLSTFVKQTAQIDAKYAKTLAAVLDTYASDKTKLKTTYTPELDHDFEARLANLDGIKTDTATLTSTVEAETESLIKLTEKGDVMSTDLNYSLQNLKLLNFKELDATSRRLLMDFNENHKQASLVRWIKLILAAGILFYLREKWKLILAIYVGLYVAWYVYKGIRGFVNVMRAKKNAKPLGPLLCSDGITPANNDSSNCPAFKAVYSPCNTSTFGCMQDGYAAPSVEAKGETLACWASPLGCCANGSVNNNNCDVYSQTPCGSTKFGCCENQDIKVDAEGSNCTMQTACGRSAFGCCPNGRFRNAKGTNCK